MDTKELYRAPAVELKREIPLPLVVKGAYALIVVFVAIGVLDGFLVVDYTVDDLMAEFSFTMLLAGLSLFLGWLLYRPIRDRDLHAYQLPLFLLIIFGGLALYEIYKGEYVYDSSGIVSLVELPIFMCLFLLTKSNKYKLWCEDCSNK